MAPVTDHITNVLENSLSKNKEASLQSKLKSTAKRALLTRIEYEPAGAQHTSHLLSLKRKYTVLCEPEQTANPTADAPSSSGGGGGGDASATTTKPCRPSSGRGDPSTTLCTKYSLSVGWGQQRYPVGAGMFNLGNTCYLNSSLQALLHVPALVRHLLEDGSHGQLCARSGGHEHCILCAVTRTLRATHQRQNGAVKPMTVYSKLKLICRQLVHGRQEDAHEFVRYLLESMQRGDLQARRANKLDSLSKETAPLSLMFGGYLKNQVTCLRCRFSSTTFQHFQDLLVDIRQCSSLDDGLHHYFRKEKLDGAEYKCERCRMRVPATKKFYLEDAPLVLCIQLKRFGLGGGKISKHVSFPNSLNLSRFLSDPPKNGQVVYTLTSLVNHMGASPNCGHYTAVARANNGQLYLFDDCTVRSTSMQSMLATNAYLLFYEMTGASKRLLFGEKAVGSTSGGLLNGYKSPQNNPRVIGSVNGDMSSPNSDSPRPHNRLGQSSALLNGSAIKKMTATVSAKLPTASVKLPTVSAKVPTVSAKLPTVFAQHLANGVATTKPADAVRKDGVSQNGSGGLCQLKLNSSSGALGLTRGGQQLPNAELPSRGIVVKRALTASSVLGGVRRSLVPYASDSSSEDDEGGAGDRNPGDCVGGSEVQPAESSERDSSFKAGGKRRRLSSSDPASSDSGEPRVASSSTSKNKAAEGPDKSSKDPMSIGSGEPRVASSSSSKNKAAEGPDKSAKDPMSIGSGESRVASSSSAMNKAAEATEDASSVVFSRGDGTVDLPHSAGTHPPHATGTHPSHSSGTNATDRRRWRVTETGEDRSSPSLTSEDSAHSGGSTDNWTVTEKSERAVSFSADSGWESAKLDGNHDNEHAAEQLVCDGSDNSLPKNRGSCAQTAEPPAQKGSWMKRTWKQLTLQSTLAASDSNRTVRTGDVRTDAKKPRLNPAEPQPIVVGRSAFFTGSSSESCGESKLSTSDHTEQRIYDPPAPRSLLHPEKAPVSTMAFLTASTGLQGFGGNVTTWDGSRTDVDKECDQRKYSLTEIDDYNEYLDAGKVKKLKPCGDSEGRGDRWRPRDDGDSVQRVNPFQRLQDSKRNRGSGFSPNNPSPFFSHRSFSSHQLRHRHSRPLHRRSHPLPRHRSHNS